MRKRAVIAVCFGMMGTLAQDQTNLLTKYETDIRTNPRTSITHFRVAEICFQQHEYLRAANEFREALNGDLQPPWVEVWARLNLGKIFDLTGQRERAINEYHQAQRTKDNTR